MRVEITIGARLELLIVHQDFVDEEIKKWQQYSENLQNKIAVYSTVIGAAESSAGYLNLH